MECNSDVLRFWHSPTQTGEENSKQALNPSLELFLCLPSQLPPASYFLPERLIIESCLNKHAGYELHFNPTAEKKCRLCYVVHHNKQKIGLILNTLIEHVKTSEIPS